MRIETELKLGFKDVLIRPKRSTLKSRSDVNLSKQYVFKNSRAMWEGIPIIAANMDKTGTFSMATALAKINMLTCIHKHYTLDQWTQFIQKNTARPLLDCMMVSTGVSDEDLKKVTAILKCTDKVQFICVDVANGYSEFFIGIVERIRRMFPNKILIAGNVATGEMTEQLILSGADVVKVGIGPGSVCTTRVKTGIGYPQLSAIIECADAAHGLGGHIIADGGCVCVGDIAKAFGAGADFVMLGGMLAGHDESEGTIVEKDGEKFYEFYGMSSTKAMDKYAGGVAEYRSSEGKSILMKYKGAVEHTAKDILGGVRSACTYVGAKNLKEISKRTTFVRVSEQENTTYS